MEYCDDGDLMQKIKHQRGKLFPEDMVRKDSILNQGPRNPFSCKLKHLASQKTNCRYTKTLKYLK